MYVYMYIYDIYKHIPIRVYSYRTTSSTDAKSSASVHQCQIRPQRHEVLGACPSTFHSSLQPRNTTSRKTLLP